MLMGQRERRRELEKGASVKGGRGEPAWSDERGPLAVSLSGV